MAGSYITKCSVSIAIKEIQTKIILRCNFTTIKRDILKKSDDKCWRGCGEKGPLFIADQGED